MAHDGSLMVKSIMENEAETLLAILPGLIDHFRRHPRSLLTRFCGLFKSSEGDNWFIVMMSVNPASVQVTRVYDLKGSTYKRTTPVEKRTSPFAALKDLDLPEPLVLADPQEHATLMSQIKEDADWLRAERFIDYSLLVMVAHPHDDAPPGDADDPPRARFHSIGRELFFIGIVDMLTRYNKLLHVATHVQNGLHEGFSWQPPDPYAERFVLHMTHNVFRVEGEEAASHKHKSRLHSFPFDHKKLLPFGPNTR